MIGWVVSVRINTMVVLHEVIDHTNVGAAFVWRGCLLSLPGEEAKLLLIALI